MQQTTPPEIQGNQNGRSSCSRRVTSIQGGNARSSGRSERGCFWIGTTSYASGECDPSSPLPHWIQYTTGQLERGNSQSGESSRGNAGYLHWQWLLYAKQKVTKYRLCQAFPTTHWELTRSDSSESYVAKEETRVSDLDGASVLCFTKGIKSLSRNSKTDWSFVKKCAKGGEIELVPDDIYIRYYSTLRRIATDNLAPRAIDRSAIVYWGPTGTGKSHRAWDEAGISAFIKMPSTKWWDGYRSQEHVIIDEFRGEISINHMLRWLDKYPCNVEVKGGTLPLYAKRFWITSNLHPNQWYPDLDQGTVEALLRRLTIIECNTYFSLND